MWLIVCVAQKHNWHILHIICLAESTWHLQHFYVLVINPFKYDDLILQEDTTVEDKKEIKFLRRKESKLTPQINREIRHAYLFKLRKHRTTYTDTSAKMALRSVSWDTTVVRPFAMQFPHRIDALLLMSFYWIYFLQRQYLTSNSVLTSRTPLK